jgi:hypothetical protein
MDEKLLKLAWERAWEGGREESDDASQGAETNRFNYALDDVDSGFKKFIEEMKKCGSL